MSIFSRLFGLDKSKKDSIRSEVNIADAINAHMKWKARLQRCLDGTSDEQLDPMVICRDDQCALGQWIHGPALHHFRDDEGFGVLRSDHAQFHFVASNVVYKVQQNDLASAMELFSGEYIQASRKVIYALTELNKQLGDE
jgi:hypothetical protein